jgi:diaminopropionate ammonia-lyase
LFLQAGVGAMAGGVLGYFADYYGEQKPVAVVVEPQEANCVYQSVQIADGELHQVDGNPVTIMAGLNCGTPCGITWPILRDYVEYYISCKDYVAAHGMRKYAMPVGEDEKIVSGESGAVTLGALDLLLTGEETKDICKQMGLNKDSVILLINTEGDTDPTNYIDVVENGAYPVEA